MRLLLLRSELRRSWGASCWRDRYTPGAPERNCFCTSRRPGVRTTRTSTSGTPSRTHTDGWNVSNEDFFCCCWLLLLLLFYFFLKNIKIVLASKERSLLNYPQFCLLRAGSESTFVRRGLERLFFRPILFLFVSAGVVGIFCRRRWVGEEGLLF